MYRQTMSSESKEKDHTKEQVVRSGKCACEIGCIILCLLLRSFIIITTTAKK